MDANKAKELVKIGYVIRKTCESCKYSRLGTQGRWGTCRLHHYDHLKHNVSARELSISSSGYCPKYEMDEQFSVYIHGFKQFVEK